MKSVRLLTNVVLCYVLLAFLCLGANADVFKIADGQDTTGASAACTLPSGYSQLTIKTTRSGTSASINIECNVGDGAFVALTGAGLPITGTSDLRAISTFSCYQVRINVASCSSCSVDAWCAFNLVE